MVQTQSKKKDIESRMLDIGNILNGDYLDKLNRDVLELTQLSSSSQDSKSYDKKELFQKLSEVKKLLSLLSEKIDIVLKNSPYESYSTHAASIKNEIEDWLAEHLPETIDKMVENKIALFLKK